MGLTRSRGINLQQMMTNMVSFWQKAVNTVVQNLPCDSLTTGGNVHVLCFQWVSYKLLLSKHEENETVRSQGEYVGKEMVKDV